jgi:AcrR family transcriptional regulator
MGKNGRLEPVAERPLADESDADWQRRVVGRSLRTAAERSVDRGMNLIRAAATVLARSNGDDITVQEVADEAGQSLRTLYQYFESKNDLLLAVFEEAMRTYAQLIEEAIVDLDDPLERLAGAMLAAVRMPELSGAALDRGLIRLRLKLSETQTELVGRAQAAVTSLLLGLVEAAASAGRITVADPEGATFLILTVNAAFITAETLGNDAGVRQPDLVGITSFCLRGLGAELPGDWHKTVSARLRFPVPAPASAAAAVSRGTRPTASRGPAKK